MSSIRKVGERFEARVYFNKKRISIGLGRINEDQAKGDASMISDLIRSNENGVALSRRVAGWVEIIPPKLRKKLESHGLIDLADAHEKEAAKITLDHLIKEFGEATSDRDPETIKVFEKVYRNLRSRFGGDRNISTITKADATKFRAWLKQYGNERDSHTKELADSTVSRRCGICLQIFNHALDEEWITKNPFKGKHVKKRVDPDVERQLYVEASKVIDVIKCASSVEWRLLIALGRFAGLRTPSEPALLRWSEISSDRIIVHSKKTRHHIGKSKRSVPIFPALRPFIDEARSLAENDFVIPFLAAAPDTNVRQNMLRWIKNAGHDQWPKVWNNLRASCIRDLLRDCGDIKQVAAWVGNRPEEILKSYIAMDEDQEQRTLERITNWAN